jgi:cytochrome c-type biogenesis protein CcmH/NrfG
MSLIDGLASLVREMSLGELALALFAVLAYSMAINSSYGSTWRSGAASVAFAASVGFTTASPSWMSAIVFLAMAVAAVAAFAAGAWLTSALLGLTNTEIAVPTAEPPAPMPSSPQPARGFAPHTSAQPL